MENLIIALGLVFVIEGSFLTLLPERSKKLMTYFMSLTPQQLRIIGLSMAICGFAVIAFMRG